MQKEDGLVSCKICDINFIGHHKQLCCSEECKKINSDRIKRKYYDRVVVPNLPGPRIKKTKEDYIEYHKEYRSAPERKKYMKEYRRREGSLIKERESGRAYKKRNPEVCKNGHLKRNFGISLETFNEMLTNQLGTCAICKKEEVKVFKKTGKVCDLCVDHCHTTGKVRGLLCWNCNTSLGKFKDSIEVLENAITYLKKGEK